MSLIFDFTADEVVEEGRCERNDIDKIKVWTRTVGLPNATDEQIVLFLLACDGDIEYTKTTIKAYYYYMYHGKNVTNKRNIHSNELMHQSTVMYSIVIPKRTRDNYLVVCQKLKDCSHWNFNLEPSLKYLIMTLELGLMGKPPPDGLVAVFDMTGVAIMHLTRLRVGPLRVFFHLLQEALPFQIKAIHVLNSTYFIDKVVSILKPLMKKDLFKKIHFHPPNIDMEEFFENYVEADCLPSDYGGNQPSVRTLGETTLENMKSKSEWYIIEENMRKNYNPDVKY